MSGAWEVVIGLEIHNAAGDEQQDVFRCCERLWGRAQHTGLPGRPRLPGRVAGIECRRGTHGL